MKIVAVGLMIVAAILLVGAGGLAAHRGWRQHQLSRAWRITSPNGIEEGRYLDINGRPEWITIRGEDRRKPVVLFLHGGPSEANSPFVGLFRPFEKDYVFVQWDQPGAGKTYIRAGKHQPTLTLDGIADDGIAVAAQLRDLLHAPKIILIGQDWGGLVGLEMIRKRPDLFETFVGTGQIVSWLGEQQPQYESTLRQAASAHDQKTLDGLKRIGPPPYRSLEAYRRFGDYFEPYKFGEDVAAEGQLRRALYLSPELSWPEMFGWARALRSGEDTLTPVMMGIDLRAADRRFLVPVFFIQGEADSITPTTMVADYLATVQAPMKRLDTVPGAGHMVIWQNPEAFLTLLKDDLKRAAPQ